MSCKLESDFNKNATKLTNNGTGRTVYIPHREKWEYIRFRVKQGDRLGDAYDKADVFDLLPSADLIPCIKSVYLTTDIDPYTRQRVDKPYSDGLWIAESFCNCLASKEGRIDLGDGFIVPSPEDQSCMVAMLDQGRTLSDAFMGCCPEIMPPGGLDYMENSLKATSAPFYDIMKAAHSLYVAGLLNPPQTPPVSPTDDNDKTGNKTMNYIMYGAIAILLLFFVGRED